ncbi:hypothetical protein S349_52 [Shewanella sp. phage 3/49]|uniref:hypothetical protein n=1 Tax=Shewanella sp. phage 3/49 TaxID=1458863 RepID=UPI0004F80035|nr:hypothetical protein S349_52 [Shewanella sp. phage 3/49]AHK11842.1 hypothetical protein S349_52 [Shewanella sp. phage 3/49]
MWEINGPMRNFTLGKPYKALSENSFNVALRNNNDDVQYVEKKHLIEIPKRR